MANEIYRIGSEDLVDRISQFGGTNLAPGTSATAKSLSIGQYYSAIGIESTSFFGLKAGETYTYTIKLTAPSGKNIKARIQFFNTNSDRVSVSGNFVTAGTTGYSYLTSTLTSTQRGYAKMQLLIECNDGTTNTDTCYYSEVKLERGTKPTDWTPAPQDLVKISGTELELF